MDAFRPLFHPFFKVSHLPVNLVYWLFFWLILSPLTIFGQFPSATPLPLNALPFESIGLDQGLSQGMVNFILQDKYGFMWFATKDGLNRFDGYQFVVFRHKPGDSTSLGDNYVTTLFEDSRGLLWVGTSGQGLDLFERTTGTFIHFKSNGLANPSISNNTITCIDEHPNGSIWVGTNFGLNVISPRLKPGNLSPGLEIKKADFEFRKVVLNPADPKEEWYTKQSQTNYELTNFHIDKRGGIWVSCSGRLLYMKPKDKTGGYSITTLPIENYFYFPFKDHGLERHVHAFVENEKQNKLYLISSFSISEVDLATNAIRWVSKRRLVHGHISHQAAVDPSGNLWFSESEQLLRVNVQTGLAEQVTDLNNRSGAEVMFNGAFADQSGVLWAGSKGMGLFKLNMQATLFHNHPIGSVRHLSALNDTLIAIVHSDNTIRLFNSKSGTFLPNVPDQKAIINLQNYQFGIIDAVAPDGNGGLWITKSRLLHYHPGIKKLEELRTSDQYYFPLFVGKDNSTWIGTDQAFNQVLKSPLRLDPIPFPSPVWNFPYTFIQCVLQDDDGTFWLGTNAGLMRLNAKTRQWKVLKNDPQNPASLGFDLIFSLCADPLKPNRYLWIGTNGGGLNRLDKKTMRFQRFTMEDGLPNNVVYGMLPDKSGNIWLSTNQGLARFNIRSSKSKNFSKSDGLQSNEFNRYSYCSDGLGNLFFGGINGFDYFKPEELKDNTFKPKVVVTNIRIMNRTVGEKGQPSNLNLPPFLTKNITLGPDDIALSLDFAAMEYSVLGKNVFRYKLEGFDPDYVNNGTKHSLTYTNLDPGKYTLKLVASSNGELWTRIPTTLTIIVLAPWYQTWWFRLLALSMFFGLVYAIYRYRLGQIIKLQMVRNTIAQDLHDEVGSNLSSISIFSELAASEAKDNSPEVSKILERINLFSLSSMEAMSDIVWMIDPKNDKFENIIFKMQQMAAELFEARKMHLFFEVDQRLHDLKMNMADRKNFWLIFKEAVNNAAKYSQAIHVWVRVSTHQNRICLEIKDDGIGFDLQKKQTGNGLSNMAKRAASMKANFQIDSEKGIGTTLRLEISA